MEHPIMACGHAANATQNGQPCCAICIGIHPGAEAVAITEPDFSGRQAECCYCNNRAPSSTTLAFFEYCPSGVYDRYYCGCRGWD